MRHQRAIDRAEHATVTARDNIQHSLHRKLENNEVTPNQWRGEGSQSCATGSFVVGKKWSSTS